MVSLRTFNYLLQIPINDKYEIPCSDQQRLLNEIVQILKQILFTLIFSKDTNLNPLKTTQQHRHQTKF